PLLVRLPRRAPYEDRPPADSRAGRHMKGARITKYDVELVAMSRRFLDAAAEHTDSRSLLERYGFVSEEQERGARLVREAERAFEWERAGRAYNFLSPTPERRAIEA